MLPLTGVAELVVAQAEGASSSPLSGLAGMAPLLLMFVVFYFLLIRPAGKQKKDHQAMLTAIKKDDEVITSGGIYGRVVSVEDKTLTLEIADRVKVRVLRDRIAGRAADGVPKAGAGSAP